MSTELRTLFPGLVIWHKDKEVPYYQENSVRMLESIPDKLRGEDLPKGVTLALDVDGRVSADQVAMATHWRTPLRYGFHDPKGLIAQDANVDALDADQLRRLRAGGELAYRMPTLDRMLKASGKTGVAIAYDVKPDKAFTRPEVWEGIRDDVANRNAYLVAMTEQRYGGTGPSRDAWERGAWARLAAAHKVGVPTLLLHRARVDWNWWGPVLDGIKAHPAGASVLVRPKDVARLGLGPSTATQYGSGAQDANIRGTVRRVHAWQVERDRG